MLCNHCELGIWSPDPSRKVISTVDKKHEQPFLPRTWNLIFGRFTLFGSSICMLCNQSNCGCQSNSQTWLVVLYPPLPMRSLLITSLRNKTITSLIFIYYCKHNHFYTNWKTKPSNDHQRYCYTIRNYISLYTKAKVRTLIMVGLLIYKKPRKIHFLKTLKETEHYQH